MRYCFPKSLRLRTRGQYKRLAQGSKRLVGTLIIIDYRPNYSTELRLGITVSKKYGEAHERNRFKRIVREAFRLCRNKLIQGLDLNIRPRSKAQSAMTGDIIQEMLSLIGHVNE